jgi:hypothetical protein
MTDVEFPVDPIDFSTPGDADKVVAIESWNEAGVEVATVVFTDGEIESMPMTKSEARAKAERCFGPDMNYRDYDERDLVSVDPAATLRIVRSCSTKTSRSSA